MLVSTTKKVQYLANIDIISSKYRQKRVKLILNINGILQYSLNTDNMHGGTIDFERLAKENIWVS